MKNYGIWKGSYSGGKRMADPGIVCYQHCGAKVFTLKLPEVCHVCKGQLLTSQLIPFRLPYPFVKASQYPCSVVLRPTNGDFLK